MAHYLKRNHRCEHPRNLLFVDTETYSCPDVTADNCRRLLLRLGACQSVRHNGTDYQPDEILHFHEARHFWEYVSSLAKDKSTLWVFAHNLWFDLTILGFQERCDNGEIKLANRNVRCKACSTNSGAKCRCWAGVISLEKGSAFASVLYRGKRINFVDTYNYYPVPLEVLGESIGHAKGQMPDAEASDEEWLKYCKRDVAVIVAAICNLIVSWKAHGLGNWQITAASLAFSSYRHRFMNHSIVIHDDKHVQGDEAASYFGGETTVFYRGRIVPFGSNLYQDRGFYSDASGPFYIGPVYYVDVNGLYPHVMRDSLYPSVYAVTVNRPSVRSVAEELGHSIGVANLEIDTSEQTYPLRLNGATWYLRGRFWTTLGGDELKSAVMSGHVNRIDRVHYYVGKPLFVQWVDYWHRARRGYQQSGNLASESLCKMLLTSLSGKFAQRSIRWITDKRGWPQEEWCKWVRRSADDALSEVCRSIGRFVQVEQKLGYADHAFVAIAACITANGRHYMRNIRRYLPQHSILYQDTDSFFLTEEGYQTLVALGFISPDELGKFKLVKVIESGEIISRKDYVANGKVVKAGLPRNAKQIANRKWECELFEDGNDVMNRTPDGTVAVYKTIISGGLECIGRTFDSSGWSQPIDATQFIDRHLTQGK